MMTKFCPIPVKKNAINTTELGQVDHFRPSQLIPGQALASLTIFLCLILGSSLANSMNSQLFLPLVKDWVQALWQIAESR